MDVVDHCTRERANTKWKFYNPKNVTVLASLLKDIPMGCKYTVSPEPLLKNHNLESLLLGEIRDNPTMTSSFFKALAILLHGKDKLEEETVIF